MLSREINKNDKLLAFTLSLTVLKKNCLRETRLEKSQTLSLFESLSVGSTLISRRLWAVRELRGESNSFPDRARLKSHRSLPFQPTAGNNTHHCREVDARINYAFPRYELELRCKERKNWHINYRRERRRVTKICGGVHAHGGGGDRVMAPLALERSR